MGVYAVVARHLTGREEPDIARRASYLQWSWSQLLKRAVPFGRLPPSTCKGVGS